MSSLRKLKEAALKAETQAEEFTGKRSQTTNTSTTPSSSSNNNWRTEPTLSTPATTQAKTWDKSQGIAPMEVDANAFVCYNCYQEGHAAKECKNEKQPRREIIWGGQKRSSPRKQRVAASKVKKTPDKPEKASEKKEGKKKKFVQGSSKDEDDRVPSEVAQLRSQVNTMTLQFGQLVRLLSKNGINEDQDFQ